MPLQYFPWIQIVNVVWEPLCVGQLCWTHNLLQLGEGRCSLAQPDGRRNTVRAWASSLLRDVPMGAVQIAIFEVLKAYVIQRPDISFDTNTLQAEAAFGAIGGFIGAVITTPADVVTVRTNARILLCRPTASTCASPSAPASAAGFGSTRWS